MSFDICVEKKYVTPNGTTMFLNENNRLHSFCLCLYVKAGSMYEKKKKNGISHFFEHIVFRNIHFHRGQTLYQTLDRLGLTFNATTYNELIRFQISGAPQHFAEAARILTEVFEPITLSEEEIDLERKRILAEIREEKEEECVSCLGRYISWKGTSLARSIMGKKKHLKNMTGEDLGKFQQKMLFEGSYFFYLTGQIPEDGIEILTRCVEQYPVHPTYPQGWENMAPVPEDFFHRSLQVFLQKGRGMEVFFGFDVDMTRYTTAEIDLLYDLLFRGEYCRMYQELSEKRGYVYSYDPGSEQYRNIGQIKMSYEVQTRNLAASVEAVISIFKDLKDGVGDALGYVKPNYIDNAYGILDMADDYNWIKAYEEKILCNPVHSMEERIQSYERVTSERMTQICQEIFRKENMVFAISGDEEKVSKETLLTILERL